MKQALLDSKIEFEVNKVYIFVFVDAFSNYFIRGDLVNTKFSFYLKNAKKAEPHAGSSKTSKPLKMSLQEFQNYDEKKEKLNHGKFFF